VTENIIFVVPDQPKAAGLRRAGGQDVLRFKHRAAAGFDGNCDRLRQLLDLKRLQQLNSQNAIIIRDTPDKLLLAGKLIADIDKAKPEVVVQVEVLEARTDAAGPGHTPWTDGLHLDQPKQHYEHHWRTQRTMLRSR